MSFASDQLYNGYLRKNMPSIVSKVKSREIVAHLPCLTDHDRETIEAKREISGNYNAMMLLLDCLKRRENWPEQFIAALEACEHQTMAAEIRAEYDALRGINNPQPPLSTLPAANIVMAHIHPVPSAPQQPDPLAAASAQPAQDIPSEGFTDHALPMQETSASTPAALVVEVATPPEPPQTQVVAQPEAVVVPPVTPPPSPEMPRGLANPLPPPEAKEFLSHREPEENLEPDHQDVSNETNVRQQNSEEKCEVAAVPERQNEPCEIGDSLQTVTIVNQPVLNSAILDEPISTSTAIKSSENEPETTTIFVDVPVHSTAIYDNPALTTVDHPTPSTSEEEPPHSPAPPMTDLDDPILTPGNPPVQETTPLVNKKAVVPEQGETSEPQATQVKTQKIEIAFNPSAEVMNEKNMSDEDSQSEDEDIHFSKPEVLLSVEPSNLDNTTICPPSPELGYSGNSDRLQMSEAEGASCKTNGIDHYKPKEDIPESPATSLDVEDVRENVGHVEEKTSILNQEIQSSVFQTEPTEEIAPSPTTTLISTESMASRLDQGDIQENVGHVAEEPSVLNLDVQTPLVQVNGEPASEINTVSLMKTTALFSNSSFITNEEHVAGEALVLNQEVQTPLLQVNGEPAREITPAPEISDPSYDTHQPNEPQTDLNLPGAGEQTNRLNTKYLLTAAGMGACALLIAWRFKH